MIRFIVLLVLCLVSGAHAQDAKPVVLFDGTSTAGWKQAGSGSFELKDGTLVTKGGMGLFWHEREFKDFVLSLEFKVARQGDNSGVFVRFPNPGNDPWVAVHKGHEIQICDTEKGKQTGAVYNFKNSAKLASKPAGEWNRYEIRCVGQQYTITLNDEVVNEYTASRSDRGHIGLQNHDGGAVVSFRNISVIELDGAAGAGAAAAGGAAGGAAGANQTATQPTSRPLTPVSIRDAMPGVVAEYFRDVKKWENVAAALKAQPFLVRVEHNLDLDGGEGQFRGTKLSDHFAARFTGFLRIATPGKYKLVVRSDDGATLRLGDRLVIDNATENKPMRENTTELELARGDYPLVVEYQQMAGGAGFVLSWVPPDAKDTKRAVPVPGSALFHETGAVDRIAWDKPAWERFTWDKKAWARAYGPRYVKMDYGPFIAHTIEAGKDNTVPKGLAIKLDPDGDAAVVYDTDLLRVAAGWTGGFLREQGVAFNGAHGPSPRPEGTIMFATKPGPGWANSAGEFKDPRAEPFGPLPREWAKFKGHYRAGDQTVVAYTVGGTDVLELPGATTTAGRTVFTRTLKVGPSRDAMTLLVCETSDVAGGGVGFSGAGDVGPGKMGPATELAVLWVAADEGKQSETATAAGASGAPQGAEWEIINGRLHLHLPPRDRAVTFAVNVWSGAKEELKDVAGQLRAKVEMQDIAALTRGGPARWTQEVVTKGELGAGDGPYVVDTITVPENNPWDAWMRIGGLDFFSDGRAAVCTWSGDVWVVSGIDAKLEKIAWKRYATGLFQPLGLRIVDDKVYALGRDQITRLHDLNGDGEADFYENFNNDCHVSASFHEFTMDLQTDPAGNFYYAKAGPVRPGGRGWQTITAHAGTVLKVSKDGQRLEVLATGVRAPNGMGASPAGEISIGDNEGTWTPACRLNIVSPGDFLGVVDMSKRPEPPADYAKPLCWFPHVEVDNSSGCQVWVTSDAWGPFEEDMLHLSYGKAALYKVLKEQVDGVWQGGVVRFPGLKFDTGICRARFHPLDEQLYVAGLKGWQTDGAKDGGFQRVRYTGGRVDMPREMRVTDEGITITFTSPLDRTAAADVENYAVEHWNYIWSKEYGSPQMSVAEPNVRGRDPVEVDEAVVSADGKTVLLKIADLEPVMQMKIQYKLQTDDGRPLEQAIYNTINKVGKAQGTASVNGAAPH